MEIKLVGSIMLEDNAMGDYATLCLPNLTDSSLSLIRALLKSGLGLPYEVLEESEVYVKIAGNATIFSAHYGLECVLIAIAELVRTRTKEGLIIPITGPLAELWKYDKPFRDYILVDSDLVRALASMFPSHTMKRDGITWYKLPVNSKNVIEWAHTSSVGIQNIEGTYVMHVLFSNLGDYNRGKFLAKLAKEIASTGRVNKLQLK